MYLDTIEILNFRTFRKAKIELLHSERNWSEDLPEPKLPNVNLLLGNNGLGKTTFLKAVSLAAMGPAVSDIGIFPYRLVRREPGSQDSEVATQNSSTSPENDAIIRASFQPHEQDRVDFNVIESDITVKRKGDIEQLRWTHDQDKMWHPVFDQSSDALFIVGYGATRRVEQLDQVDSAARSRSASARAQRIKSLFEEAYSLRPLSAWLPRFKTENPGRHKQVVTLFNQVMGQGHYKFTGDLEDGEYVFERNGLRVPFPALSDGYRAFLGWIGDLLYHVCMTCPSGKKLVDNHGIVMVDEIDLHIHPKWQINVIPKLAKALPNLQFIVTSHSPLVVGSLEWMNIIVMEKGRGESSVPRRRQESVHGLDADQILLSSYFDMSTTRAPDKVRRLKKITRQAREGDVEAAKQLLRELRSGTEKYDSVQNLKSRS